MIHDDYYLLRWFSFGLSFYSVACSFTAFDATTLYLKGAAKRPHRFTLAGFSGALERCNGEFEEATAIGAGARFHQLPDGDDEEIITVDGGCGIIASSPSPCFDLILLRGNSSSSSITTTTATTTRTTTVGGGSVPVARTCTAEAPWAERSTWRGLTQPLDQAAEEAMMEVRCTGVVVRERRLRRRRPTHQRRFDVAELGRLFADGFYQDGHEVCHPLGSSSEHLRC